MRKLKGLKSHVKKGHITLRNKIKHGIFILLASSAFDHVTTNLGLSKKITSFNEIFPLTVTEGIFVGINTILYLYGLFVLSSGIVQLIKRKRYA